ncbi:glutamine-rich protein 2 isoform X3 [Caretta caretta]|uniref:glutamine-rich protein 2 isoform X3 n=1 Tax=Caretta caretta TaxID=8467 RepID=UPI00209555F4|nr:glutamine-rich protein 2 isoform X4 [Caretta caretta]
MALISLLELADLSIGTPEIGVVNFNALHTLLHAIIRQLNLQNVKTEMLDEKPKPPEPVPLQEKETKGQCDASEDFPYADLEKKVIGVAAQVHGMEAKVVGVATQVHGVEAQVHGIGEQVQGLEKQMAALEKLPSGTDLLERTKSGSPNGSAVADMWQMMQMKKKIEANETGISKAMALFQDLLNEVNGMKMANFHMNEGLQNIKEKLDSNLQLDTQEIGNRLQTCIADQKNLDSDVRNLERRINLYPSPEEMYNMVRWEVLEDCLVTGKDKSPSTDKRLTSSTPRESSGSSSASSRYSDTVEVLRQIGQLTDLYTTLKEQINYLEQFKCSHADLNKLRQFLSDAVPKNLSSMPADLMDQLSSLKATAEDMKDVKAKDEELLSRIQNTILQVQGDCENLNATTGNLIEDHRQKQKDIALLFQSLEKLEKEKADKEHLETEIDVKADKIALAGKVSCTQFDATMEQLNKMMQDLVNKMSGQEQDWHKVLDKILMEMDSKLDRLELDPFRQQLEERWKAIRKQLKERSPQYEANDAAGIRKRLMAHFHCISCDRPLKMVVPGPTIMTVPSVPGLPSHRSIRPYTVYELEQVRQHTRSLKLGLSPYPRLDALQLEKSAGLGKLRSIHSKMLMDIEKVQIHFGGSAKASSQMIREIMQSQCLSPDQYNKRDKMAEMAEYGYLSMPRRCGGSHTLTYPYRRYTRLQQIAQCVPVHPEETAMLTVMKHEEVDILGLDGHIYKGRMDTRLPSISVKEGPLKTKPKLSRSSSQRQSTLMDTAGLPARPQSAKLSSPSNSGTARSLKDRPVSSEGRLSRVDLTHLSTSISPPGEAREDSPMQEKETLELHLDLSMRRRSAEQLQ